MAVCLHSYFYYTWLFLLFLVVAFCKQHLFGYAAMPGCFDPRACLSLDIFAEILMLVWVTFSMFALAPSVSDICS